MIRRSPAVTAKFILQGLLPDRYVRMSRLGGRAKTGLGRKAALFALSEKNAHTAPPTTTHIRCAQRRLSRYSLGAKHAGLYL
jgi:hypothetical protein